MTTLSSIEETQALSLQVTELLQDNKISAAFDRLAEHWPLPENEVEAIEEKTMKYFNLLRERFGPAFNAVKVKESVIPNVTRQETFIIQFPNTGIRLIYTFYKNPDGWIVNAFKWDDSFEEELD